MGRTVSGVLPPVIFFEQPVVVKRVEAPANWSGGEIFIQRAVTGWQVDAGKFPASAIPSQACEVPPLASVTVSEPNVVCRDAGVPSWLPPDAVTNDTPGKPNMSQL